MADDNDRRDDLEHPERVELELAEDTPSGEPPAESGVLAQGPTTPTPSGSTRKGRGASKTSAKTGHAETASKGGKGAATPAPATPATPPTVVVAPATVELAIDPANGHAPIVLTATATGGTEPYEYQWNYGLRSAPEVAKAWSTDPVYSGAVDSDAVNKVFVARVKDQAGGEEDSDPVTMTLPAGGDEAPETWTQAFAWIVGVGLLAVAAVIAAPLFIGVWHVRRRATDNLPAIVALDLLTVGVAVAMAGVFLVLLEYRGHAVVVKHLASRSHNSPLAALAITVLSRLPASVKGRFGTFGVKPSVAATTPTASSAETPATGGATLGSVVSALVTGLAPDLTAFGKLKASAALLITAVILFIAGAFIAWRALPDPSPATTTASTSTPSAAASQTALAVAANATDTTIKVASVDGLKSGQSIKIGTGTNVETIKIKTVGAAGATGTGITLSVPLKKAHVVAAPVIGTG